MKIALDFDGTVVDDVHEYDDLDTPLEFLPGAEEAILSLVRAQHILILYSGRANLSLRWDPQHNPLNAMNPSFDLEVWKKNQPLNQARFQQMLDFVAERLPGVFVPPNGFIDFGNQGKVSADIYIDDRAGGRPDWDQIRVSYGEPLPAEADQ